MLQLESKREEFRRYLEAAGVLDSFTKGLWFWLLGLILSSITTYAVLVGLYEEPDKPKDPMEYPKPFDYESYITISITLLNSKPDL